MGVFKISLHQSGVWVLAATAQSGATFEGGNRRAKQWNRPLEHAEGVTRGPSIFIPHTSFGHRKYKVSESKAVHWFPAPLPGEVVEFSIYFVVEDGELRYENDLSVIKTATLRSGGAVVLLAGTRRASKEYLSTCENLLRKNVFRVDDVRKINSHSFLWVTENNEHPNVPIITDLPANFRPKIKLSEAVRAALRGE